MVQRQARDADQLGLRVAQLLLPVSGHRLEALAYLNAEYNQRDLRFSAPGAPSSGSSRNQPPSVTFFAMDWAPLSGGHRFLVSESDSSCSTWVTRTLIHWSPPGTPRFVHHTPGASDPAQDLRAEDGTDLL